MSSFLKKFRALSSKGPASVRGRRLRRTPRPRGVRRAVRTGCACLKASAETIPPGIDASDPQQLGTLVGRILRDMKLAGVGLLMTVTRAEAVLKPVTLPPGTPPHEVAGMVPFQVEKDLPFRAEEAVIDFTIESHYDSDASAVESPAERGTDVLVAAVRLPVVDHYRRVAEAAGAKLLRLGLRPYANVRCVNACRPSRRGETRLLLHLGPEETEIDLLVGGSLTFSRAAAVKIPPADAPAKVLDEAVRAVAMEVRRSVQSYLAVERDLKIDEILIAGGTGLEAEAGREIGTVLEAPCNRLDVSPVAEFPTTAEASAFVSALGLAIGHGASGRLPFDFLHPKRPAPPRNRRRTTAIAAGALALAALIGVAAAGAIQISRARADAEAVQAKLLKQKEIAKGLQGTEKQVKELQQWQDEKRDWLAHWARLSALFPGPRDAYVTSLKSADTAGETSLSFTIKARDSKIITDLGDRLAEAGYKFQPGGLTTTQDRYGYQWSEEIRVFLEPDMEMDLASQELPGPARRRRFGPTVDAGERIDGDAGTRDPRCRFAAVDANCVRFGRFVKRFVDKGRSRVARPRQAAGLHLDRRGQADPPQGPAGQVRSQPRRQA